MRLYRFAWGNREIPKDTIVRLLAVGKLNTVMVEDVQTGKGYITDRRALRIIQT
jgi:hypothetical protein